VRLGVQEEANKVNDKYSSPSAVGPEGWIVKWKFISAIGQKITGLLINIAVKWSNCLLAMHCVLYSRGFLFCLSCFVFIFFSTITGQRKPEIKHYVIHFYFYLPFPRVYYIYIYFHTLNWIIYRYSIFCVFNYLLYCFCVYPHTHHSNIVQILSF
jgi:hypothetical protein